MEKGQQQFYDYILACVWDENKEEAAALMKESFQKQAEQSFNHAYLAYFNERIMPMIKPEYQLEVNQVLTNFGPEHINSDEY